MLFNQMREMGLDPEEFVVGNELNSINPVTGMPEFFFSSVWRSVKRAASSAWKGIKKAAPYVIPLVLTAFGVPGAAPGSMFGAGSFGAAFLGQGIGTLAAGGSMKDALKAGAIAGGTMALGRGLAGAVSKEAGSSFMGGVKEAFGVSPSTGQWNIISGDPSPQPLGGSPVTDPIKPTQVSARSIDYSDVPPGTPGTFQNPLARPSKVGVGIWEDPLVSPSGPPPEWLRKPAPPGAVSLAQPASSVSVASKIGRIQPQPIAALKDSATLTLQAQTAAKAAMVEAKAKAAPWYSSFTGGPSITFEGVMNQLPPDAAAKMTTSAVEKAMANVNPGPLATYGPAAGLGLLAAYAGGAFDPVETDQPTVGDLAGFTSGPTGQELFERDPQKYLVAGLDPYRYVPRHPLVPTRSAQGGLAEYPPRDLLVEGAGTERSDEIPAMLSDGEFVMNARSVRGADPSGRGNRYAGANNLYNMMRNFEMRS
jgi:hypothetical protein